MQGFISDLKKFCAFVLKTEQISERRKHTQHAVLYKKSLVIHPKLWEGSFFKKMGASLPVPASPCRPTMRR